MKDVQIVWETIQTKTEENRLALGLTATHELVRRAKVPGGWLVAVSLLGVNGVTFYPDPEHLWDGNSLR